MIDVDELVTFVKSHAQSGDMVICLGAGTIGAWADTLAKRLAEAEN